MAKIEIEVENAVLSSIVFDLIKNQDTDYYIKKLRPTETVTMCRVPEEIIGADNYDRSNYFEPKVISIGPYHSKNEALYPMQSLKPRYLNDLLRRNTDDNKVGKYTKAIGKQLVTEKAKYCEFDACGISDVELLKLLVLDGCFVVELSLKFAESPIFMLPRIDADLLRHDLFLIENQVPFSVLEKIYELTEYDDEKLEPEAKSGIFNLALYYIRNRKVNINDNWEELKEYENLDHLLHLFYVVQLNHFKRTPLSDHELWIAIGFYFIFSLSMFIKRVFWIIPFRFIVKFLYVFITVVEFNFGFSNQQPTEYTESYMKFKRFMPTIPTVTEVNYAVMKFRSRLFCRFNLFYFKGRIEEANKEIHDNFFTEFENILFYEQIYGFKIMNKEIVWGKKYKNHLLRKVYERCFKNQLRFTRRRANISTYAVYMSHLVKTNKDVDVLARHGMLEITTTTHGNKEIAEFFSKRRSWLVLPEKQIDFLCQQFKAINKFYYKPHRQRRAKLRKDYFTNLLVLFSITGFLILLSFTIVQLVLKIVK